jgi:hypothetical protein
MAVTYSLNKAVYMATAQGDVIPGSYFKAIFWVLSAATENTHLLEITEGATGGHRVYQDAAPKTHGAVAIPCPALPLTGGLYIKDLDNGYVLAYPSKKPWT